jgi:hypothetical protein
MQDQEPAAICRLVDRFGKDLHLTENPARELAERLIVVPGTQTTRVPRRARSSTARTTSAFQHGTDNLVVRLRPVDPALEASEVDDVADQVKRLALELGQEVEAGDRRGTRGTRGEYPIENMCGRAE